MTVEEFLAFEKDNLVRHEYVAGEVYRLSGPRMRHNLISLNIATRLRGPARARGCRVYVESTMVRVNADVMYYPDVCWVCGEPGPDDWVADNPSLVVEVASRSTRATDRREKLNNYRSISTLQYYIIVEQRRREVTLHFRKTDGSWDRLEFLGTGRLDLSTLGASLTLDEIYDDVPMPDLRMSEQYPEWLYEDAYANEGSEDDDDF
jgi:Uma2 family endonuclease